MIDIKIDPYGLDDTKLFNYDSISLQPGITVLVGCNGSGKTTFMKKVDDYINKNKIQNTASKVFTCCETHKTVDALFNLYGNKESIDLGINIMCSSEGEGIAINLQVAFNWLWAQCKRNDINSIIFSLDSLDSGVDIPILKMILDVLKSSVSIAKDEFDVDLYIIISANSYALVENQNCMDVRTGKQMIFRDWDQYADFCIKSDSYKQKRYES